MAKDEAAINESATAVAERAPDMVPGPAPDAPNRDKKKKAKEDPIEYEYEFSTPFGKLEFEFEPTDAKERRDALKREKAAAQALKDEAKAKKKADAQAKKLAAKGQQFAMAAVAQPKGGGGKLIPMLVIFGIVAGAIALAIWLFARPGEEADDVVPAEFLNAEAMPAAEPQGFVAKMRARAREAVHAGRKASREVQAEQQRKFEDMTRGGS